MSQDKIEVHKKRFYSAHHTLVRIASDSLTRAEIKDPGYGHHEFVAISFSALAIEAICNAVGERATNHWQDYESCSPQAKLRIICRHLNLDYKGESEPWSSALWLSSFRNKIAHPKAEDISQKFEVTGWDESNQEHRGAPKSALEREININNARRSVTAVKKILELFSGALPMEKQFGISTDMWATSAKPRGGG